MTDDLTRAPVETARALVTAAHRTSDHYTLLHRGTGDSAQHRAQVREGVRSLAEIASDMLTKVSVPMDLDAEADRVFCGDQGRLFDSTKSARSTPQVRRALAHWTEGRRR